MSERHPPDPGAADDGRAPRPDDETVLRWLDLEADGALSPEEVERLEVALESRPDLAAERRALADLHRHLAAARIPVRPGFRDGVLEALPEAAWEPAGRRGWGLAAAVLVLLGAGGALAFAMAGIGGAGSGSLAGIATAIGDLLAASLITGAGLLGASWRGVGLALEELLAASPSTVVALGLAVVLLNLLFWRLLRRDAPGALPADTPPDPDR